MELNEFKDLLFSKAKEAGFSDCEIYFSGDKSFQAQIFGGEVKEYKNSRSKGLSFRGTFGDNTGYSYTEKIDGTVIDFLIESAKLNAAVIEDEKESLFSGSERYIKIEDEQIIEISALDKIEKAKLMEKTALEADPRIKQVIYSCVGDGTGEISISNSLGLDLSQKSDYAMAYVYVQAEENNQTKMGYEIFTGNDFSNFDPSATAKKAVSKAISLLGAKDVKTGKYPVIFNNMTAADLLTTFSGVFYAENVQKGFSMLGGKLGEKIASEVLTINDFAVHPKSLNSLSFDSEGVATYDKAVISGGVLKTYLYNLKSAAKDNVASTGNGFKASFKSSVSTACANFFICPSETTEEALIAQMGDGLYITDLAGLHSGANAVSGDFSLQADGFLVEGGKISTPIEQFTVAGNFYDMLKMVINVADNLFFDIPGANGAIGAPSVMVGELSVSGGK